MFITQHIEMNLFYWVQDSSNIIRVEPEAPQSKLSLNGRNNIIHQP